MTDRPSRAALRALRARRWFRRAFARPFPLKARFGRIEAAELLIAPSDIRTADPTRAEDIYAGYLVFAGRMVNGAGRPPFDIPPPTPDFARELAGFAWLRHMRTAGTALARSNAQALVRDFIVAEPRLRRGPAGEPAVAARRLLSWLSQAPFLLGGADSDFYRAFMRALGRDAALLARRYGETVGADRLLAGIALTQLALCADLGPGVLKRASNALGEEMARQLFADGGHVGRNPDTLVELMLDLLPLRQSFAARNQAAPQAVLNALDRMIPMLRLLRHGDGSIALFNGMGVTAPDHIATVLAYADARGRALLSAPHAGYQRLEGADARVIVDAGAAPPMAQSGSAHAGCASFEFSLGLRRVVGELRRAAAWQYWRCPAQRARPRPIPRSSSTTPRRAGLRTWALMRWWRRGPKEVSADRREQPDGALLDIAHDGYVRRFGLRHRRKLMLARDGSRLSGEDRLESAGAVAQNSQRFDLRFHLHPDIRVHVAADGLSVQLGADADRLVFHAGGRPLAVEESVFFASPTGMQRCQQIVVSGPAMPDTLVAWSFSRA